jgi:hypothetical protein
MDANWELGGAFAAVSGSLKNDILWGVKALSEEIDRTERQTFYLLETGQLPAKKVGGRWCSTRTTLREFFSLRLLPAGEGT